MAVVYRAQDQTLRREVAIKVLAPHLVREKDTIARFVREARAAGALDHPHILKIFDIAEGDADAGTPPFIVMELIRGRTLRAFLDERGAPLAEIVAMLGAILADALHVAHERGVIHRDVKPANVMITDDGRPILCDFGVARMDDDALATQSGMVLGTPTYMSPEQALGKPVDARGDVYSLGATLYHAASGAVPYSGTTAAVLSAVMRGELVPPLRKNPAMGAALSREIVRAMHREPAARHASAKELAAALAELARVPGLGERHEELRAYFTDPGAWNERARPLVVAAAFARAQAAHDRREIARALAECDRVLALDPAHEGAAQLVAGVGHGARRRRALVVTAAVLGVLALASAAVLLLRGHGAPVAAAIAADAAALTAADPDAATVAAPTADAATAAVAARSADARPADAGAHAARLRPDAATVAARPADAGAAPFVLTAPPDARPATGHVLAKLGPWCNLTVDGTARGEVRPKGLRVELPAGPHDLVCAQGAGGRSLSKHVELAAGDTVVWQDSLIGQVTVTIAAAGVAIDGTRYARGDAPSLSAASHRVELLDNERVVDTAHLTFTVACTLRDHPLRCDEK